MILSEAISKINYALRGIDDDAPVEGSDEYSYWVSVLNRKKDELYEDVTKRWSNVFEARSLGTISATDEPTFDLDDDFLAPSNRAYVLLSSGSRSYFPIVKPEEAVEVGRYFYIAGQDPQTLYFSREILSDDQIVGGELFLPAYFMPDDFTNAGQTLLVPDANWLVMATAAEIAYNDIIYEDRAEGLNAKANNLYQQMIAKNRRGTWDNPRRTPTVVKRIRGTVR